MRHNKVLGLAIASALALGASLSFGGTLETTYAEVDATTNGCTKKTGNPTFACELFFGGPAVVAPMTSACGAGPDDLDAQGEGGPAAEGSYDDNYLHGIYKFDTKVLGSAAFIAKFSLTNEAQFGDKVELGASTNLDFVAHPSGTHAGVVKTTGGNKGDTEVTFYITPKTSGEFSKNDTLFLRYNLQNLVKLQSAGDKVELKAEVFVNPNDTISFDGTAPIKTVAECIKANVADIKSATGTAKIDVAQDNKGFIGDSSEPVINATTIKLGEISVKPNSTPSGVNILKADMKKWAFSDNPSLVGGSLTIQHGPFSASITEPGKVFLDLDNNNIYDETVDIKADTIKEEGYTAEWQLSAAEVKSIYDKTTISKGISIIVQADGTNPISEPTQRSEATFTVNYGGPSPETVKRNLLLVKLNGLECSLYNVPSNLTASIDEVNIRVTNLSSQDGSVSASLRDKDGNYVFINKQLIEKIGANETVRLTAHDLCKIEKEKLWIDAHPGKDCWEGRAVLTVKTTLPEIEVFGLLRNKMGGPLTNLSLGGTGNGCD